ncbi:aggregation-promoting factor C-terminal-like domain-containing protein [Peterkaempfera bronchialis]|uniref:Lytic transglycosylase domain-containing protein n=1 Tax=Peterkaempfera bronchialis TaxID=2126346 RepID=A0A345T257_9ACTN|nr:lytic transglycosylase domain-containing protein [Peterkaempfera bronchialis]
MFRTHPRRSILIAGASTTAVAAAATVALIVPQLGPDSVATAEVSASTAPVAELGSAGAPQTADAAASGDSRVAETGKMSSRSETRAQLQPGAATTAPGAAAEEKAAAAAKAAADHRAHLIAQANAKARAEAAAKKAAADHRAHVIAQANAKARAQAAAKKAAAAAKAAADHQAHLIAQANAKARAEAAAKKAAAVKKAAPKTLSGSPQEIARQIVGNSGQYQCFAQIVQHESSWNPTATNPSSGAYGLVQALPGSKMASAGADWRTNPATQIKWGLSYMNERYGSPCGAWSFWQSHHWY